ncbi:TPA: hypothetical protein HA242_05880 [Candidatus Woesearchaeota archaeon]|nr:hypothetical protein [Candidatus Woesearchaeota archaeon]HIH13225.1 hypothetical protein [Candidatus Woesearchaeota archaeon]
MEKVVRQLLDLEYFKSVLPVQYTPGLSALLLLTGENASGKSFFVRLMAAYVHFRLETEPILVDMSLRTESDIKRALVFGDEERDSTGNISLKSVINGIKTSKGRQNAHYLMYDEPEIGLSDGYQMALGNYVAKFMDELPAKIKGLVIATHSKYVARPLVPYNPNHIRFGDTLTLEQWLEEEPREKSEAELLALQQDTLTSSNALLDILRKAEEKKTKKRKRAT